MRFGAEEIFARRANLNCLYYGFSPIVEKSVFHPCFIRGYFCITKTTHKEIAFSLSQKWHKLSSIFNLTIRQRLLQRVDTLAGHLGFREIDKFEAAQSVQMPRADI